MSVADYDIYMKEVAEKINKSIDDYFKKQKENKEMKRTKTKIEKEIIENVNASDVLQKTNALFEQIKTEELKKENPVNYAFEYENDYLAHLKVIYQINILQETNREEIGKLGLEYINLKKELLGYDT